MNITIKISKHYASKAYVEKNGFKDISFDVMFYTSETPSIGDEIDLNCFLTKNELDNLITTNKYFVKGRVWKQQIERGVYLELYLQHV